MKILKKNKIALNLIKKSTYSTNKPIISKKNDYLKNKMSLVVGSMGTFSKTYLSSNILKKGTKNKMTWLYHNNMQIRKYESEKNKWNICTIDEKGNIVDEKGNIVDYKGERYLGIKRKFDPSYENYQHIYIPQYTTAICIHIMLIYWAVDSSMLLRGSIRYDEILGMSLGMIPAYVPFWGIFYIILGGCMYMLGSSYHRSIRYTNNYTHSRIHSY